MELGKLDRTTVLAAFWRGAAVRLVLSVFFPWLAILAASEFSVGVLFVSFLIGSLVLLTVRGIARV